MRITYNVTDLEGLEERGKGLSFLERAMKKFPLSIEPKNIQVEIRRSMADERGVVLTPLKEKENITHAFSSEKGCRFRGINYNDGRPVLHLETSDYIYFISLKRQRQ